MSIIGQREDTKRSAQECSTNQLKRPFSGERTRTKAPGQNVEGMFLRHMLFIVAGVIFGWHIGSPSLDNSTVSTSQKRRKCRVAHLSKKLR